MPRHAARVRLGRPSRRCGSAREGRHTHAPFSRPSHPRTLATSPLYERVPDGITGARGRDGAWQVPVAAAALCAPARPVAGHEGVVQELQERCALLRPSSDKSSFATRARQTASGCTSGKAYLRHANGIVKPTATTAANHQHASIFMTGELRQRRAAARYNEVKSPATVPKLICSRGRDPRADRCEIPRRDTRRTAGPERHAALDLDYFAVHRVEPAQSAEWVTEQQGVRNEEEYPRHAEYISTGRWAWFSFPTIGPQRSG
jgi:hypothetical protein